MMGISPGGARAQILSSAEETLAAARAYAALIAGGVIERDRAGSVPWAELAALDASGLPGITVPAAGNYLLSDVPPPNHGRL